MNTKAIKDRLVSLLKDKSSGIQPEFQNQLFEIINFKCNSEEAYLIPF